MVTDPAARTADYTFDLSGGRLCLDFTNTVSDRGHEGTKSRRTTKKRFSFSCPFVVFAFSWLHLSLANDY